MTPTEYLALAMLFLLRSKGNDLPSTINDLSKMFLETYGWECNEPLLSKPLDILKKWKAIELHEDKYAGTTFVVDAIVVRAVISDLSSENVGEAIKIANSQGAAWFRRVFSHPRFWDDLEGDDFLDGRSLYEDRTITNIPASDRIVTISHNQKLEIDLAATELVDLVELENGVDGDPVERDLVLGQIKAGRELIRAQTFKAYLLYNALFTALGKLIEKYGTAAIGTAAKKLLELLIENVFK